jgi:hypothetical protein
VEDKNPAEMQHVVDLLQKLGKVEVHYPVDLLAQRQAEFLNSVSAVQAAGSASTGIAASAKETLLHFVLGAVIVVELAVGAYITRDLWLPMLQDETVAIESNEIVDIFPTATEDVPTEVVVPTEMESATPTFIATDSLPDASSSDLTPVPPSGSDHPGRHLGQTPVPSEAPKPTKKP